MTAPALVKRYAQDTDSDASDALIVADTLTSGSHPGSNMPGRRREDDTNIVEAFNWQGDTNQGADLGSTDQPSLTSSSSWAIPISQDALRGEGVALTPSPDAEGRIRLRDPGFAIGEDGDPAFTLAASAPGAIAWETRYARNGRGAPDTVAPPLKAQNGRTGKGDGAPMVGVRRLTPVECERLQGFPDGWTAIDGDQTPDSRRYAACGNAVTVNVAEWIGHRLAMHIGEPSPALASSGGQR